MDPLSFLSVRLESFGWHYEKQCHVPYGFASGCVVKSSDRYFLITNGHVVTGLNADTRQPLCSKTAALPSLLRLHFVEDLASLRCGYLDISLENHPWIEHPLGARIDVVALPLQEDLKLDHHVLDLNLSKTDIPLHLDFPISIVGFPRGLEVQGLPICLRGCIASEPNIDAQGKPVFYANVDGQEGLSGSPVFARNVGPHQDSRRNFIWDGRTRTRFLGIYSGRVDSEARVCRIWKPSVIDDLLFQKNVNKSQITCSIQTLR